MKHTAHHVSLKRLLFFLVFIPSFILLIWVRPVFAASYVVAFSNERSDTVTLLDGNDQKILATIPVGKRPRGIHPSPDGKLLYVALSGSPISAPRRGGSPKIDDDDDQAKPADHSADGIGIIDVAQRRFLKKIPGGSDPEQFAVSADGATLYIANEDHATVTAAQASDGTVLHVFPVKKEPEGVALTPDGRQLLVTCEAGGEVFVIDTRLKRTLAEVSLGGRPRNIVFSLDGKQTFIPSESTGQVHVLDSEDHKILKSIFLPPNSRPMGLALSANGSKLYASAGWAGTICVIDTAAQRLTNTIKVGSRPWGIAMSPDGARLFVANGPSNDGSVVDLANEKELARIKMGDGPWGVAVVPTPQ